MDSNKLYKWTKENEDNNIVFKENRLKESQVLEGEQTQKKVADADPGLLDKEDQKSLTEDKRPDVFDHLSPTLEVFSRKESLLRGGKYTFLSKKGEFVQGTRSTPSKKYMKPILDNLKRLDGLLSGQFDAKDTDTIHNCFRDTIISCENYISNRNPWTTEGKARLQMVKDFQAQIRHESVRFAQRVEELEKNPELAKENRTWLSILSDVRREDIQNGRDGVKVTMGGAGSSTIYIIEKDGKKRFFKENEKVPKDGVIANLNVTLASLKDKKDEKDTRRLKYLEIAKKALIKRYATEVQFFKDFMSVKNRNAMTAKLCEKLKSDKNFANMIYEIRKVKPATEEDDDLLYISEAILQAKRDAMLSEIAVDDAKIDAKSDVSKRNVATSRMAKILGLDYMVAGSTIADVTVNGKKMSGIAMEEAKGECYIDIGEAAVKKKRKPRYSPKAFKQILNLQIFDVICGQVDRNAANYLCTYEEKADSNVTEIKEIKAIDNDLSFGRLSYNEIVNAGRQGVNRLRSFEDTGGKLTIPCVDKELADKILAVDTEMIDYQMCDILDKDERKALIDRIKGVQKIIRKMMNEERKKKAKGRKTSSKFPENDESWVKAYNDYMKEIGDKARKNKAETDLDLYRTTYLDLAMMYG